MDNIYKTLSIILLCCFAMTLIVLSIYFYYIEKKTFNNGLCNNCKNKLRHSDTDSQGGRRYTCDKCNYSFWISYNFDKKIN